MDLAQTLHHIFTAAVAPEKDVREAVESRLLQLSQEDPYLVTRLIQYSASEMGDMYSRQGAAIRVKNVITRSKKNWTTVFSDDVKQNTRAALLEAQCSGGLDRVVHKQLAAVIQSVIDYDYPEQWPDLVGFVANAMQYSMENGRLATDEGQKSGILVGLRGALSILRCVCKSYEDVTKYDAKAIDNFCSEAIPVILRMGKFLLEWLESSLAAYGATGCSSPCNRRNIFLLNNEISMLDECVKLNLKCIWSLTSGRFPAILCDANGVAELCSFLLRCWSDGSLRMTSLYGARAAGLSQSEATHQFAVCQFWKSLKWLGNISHRFLNDFIVNKHVEERARGAGQYFMQGEVCGAIAQHAMKCIKWHHCPTADTPSENRGILTSKAFIMCLEYIDAGVNHEGLYRSNILPEIHTLLTEILFTRLFLSEEEKELWETNPEEYVRKQNDPRGDLYNPKIVSMALIIRLTVGAKKFHDSSLLGAFVGFLLEKLQNKNHSNLRGYQVTDACLFSISQLKRALPSINVDDAKLEWLMTELVAPELSSDVGFLRARSVLVISTFLGIEWSSAGMYQKIVSAVLPLLSDREVPVSIQTCITLSRFIRHEYARPIVTPQISVIVEQYFKIMKFMDNDSVVRTLRKTIKFYSETLSKWAVQLCAMLVEHFQSLHSRLATRESELENVTLDEHEGTGDIHDSLSAADELISTLITLVKSIPPPESSPNGSEVFFHLQQSITPMLTQLLSHGTAGFGFIEGALELLTTLLSHSKGVAPETWQIFPCLYHLVRLGATDYFGQLLSPIDNFLSIDPSTFMAQSYTANDGTTVPFMNLLLEMCEMVLAANHLRNREIAAVPKVIESVFLNALERGALSQEISSSLVRTFLPCVVTALTMPRASPASPSLKILFANDILSALFFSPIGTADSMASLGGNLQVFFQNYFSVISELPEDNEMREYDRKLFIAAVISIGKVLAQRTCSPDQQSDFEGAFSLCFNQNCVTMALSEDEKFVSSEMKSLEKVVSKREKQKRHGYHNAVDVDDDLDFDDDYDDSMDDEDGFWGGDGDDEDDEGFGNEGRNDVDNFEDHDDGAIKNHAEFSDVLAKAQKMSMQQAADNELDEYEKEAEWTENQLDETDFDNLIVETNVWNEFLVSFYRSNNSVSCNHLLSHVTLTAVPTEARVSGFVDLYVKRKKLLDMLSH